MKLLTDSFLNSALRMSSCCLVDSIFLMGNKLLIILMILIILNHTDVNHTDDLLYILILSCCFQDCVFVFNNLILMFPYVTLFEFILCGVFF